MRGSLEIVYVAYGQETSELYDGMYEDCMRRVNSGERVVLRLPEGVPPPHLRQTFERLRDMATMVTVSTRDRNMFW